ncbi:hypothetical protein DCC77_02105 [Candidatus Uhrbacteria bacterium]|nr:MAG: hypothetical protein DCC77_02105 [Candidatus Uhrbacteria bacterium]
MRLKKLEARARPRRYFQSRLRTRLVYPHGRPWHVVFVRPVAGMLTVAAVMGAGTSVYAYSSEDVLPSHPLYPVRQTLERVEERIAFSNTHRANLERKILLRRVREAELMEVRRMRIGPQDIERMMRAMQEAIDIGEKLPPPLQNQHDQMVAQAELQHAKLIERVLSAGGNGENAKVERLMKRELGNLGERIEKMDERRRRTYENLLIRRAAMMRKMPWRIENGNVFVIPPADINIEPFAPTSVNDLEQRLQEAEVFITEPSIEGSVSVSETFERLMEPMDGSSSEIRTLFMQEPDNKFELKTTR